MQVPRSFAPAVLLVLAIVVAPIAGVALANAARPVIPEGAATSLEGPPTSAMPRAPATIRPLRTWFDRLPIVDAGTDATPRPFLDAYRAVPVGDQAAANALIDVAFGEITVPRASQAIVRDFLDALVLEPEEVDVDDPGAEEGDDVPVIGPFDTAEFSALADRAMTAIAADPSNARALNDLAVAIATAALIDPSVVLPGSGAGRAIAASPQLVGAAIRLLELGRSSFPADRAMAINVAYLRSLDTGSDDESEEDEETPRTDSLLSSDPGIVTLQAYVDEVPTDVTARSLLANLAVRTDRSGGLDRAIAFAEPFTAEPDTEAAGRIIRADSLLFAADLLRTGSPFTARDTVRRALDDYDRAIELTGDAAAYVGRARALDLLGDRDAALESQREAVRLDPTSITWRLRLAQLEGCAGNLDLWRSNAHQALATANAATNPPMVATRYILADLPGLDYGRYSIGSDLPTWDVTIHAIQGGVIIAAIDPFPEPEACMSREPTATTGAPESAIEVALAALADDDLTGARAVLEPWRSEEPTAAEEDPDAPIDDEAEEPETADADAVALAVELLGGAALGDEGVSIAPFVPLASRLPADVQGETCRALAGVIGLDLDDADALVACAAEAIDRTGDHAAAADALGGAIRLDDTEDPSSGSTVIRAGMLNELAGDLETARARYEAAATFRETSVAGLTRLGDLDLREGDATGALDHYALAEAALRTQGVAADEVKIDDAMVARLDQYIDNNRGIALLMTARTVEDAPPDCGANPEICAEARDAFAAALAADPMNPVYPMNAAWVARLTGDGDRATALLETALEQGTPLVAPALNDLGVLAARRGDLNEARAQFIQAAATDPEYDLAIWNLGVLDARQAGPMIVAGQALLADAIGRDPDLLTRELTFQGDERVYRVEVSGAQLELARAPGTGAAIGAAAFGAIATVGALAQLVSGIGGDVKDAAETVGSEGLGRASRRLRRFGGRGRPGGRAWPSWFAWLPAIALLTVTTAWTALWMAPDAFVTALVIGLAAAGLSIVVHACGHLVVAGQYGARLEAAGWTPGVVLAIVGLPFHVPAGPFLAERITTGDARRDWWVSLAGVIANLGAASIALLIYLFEPMPFLRILAATQLAVAAFALIPSDPLDGERLSTRPVVLALLALGVAAVSTAIAVGAI